MKIYKLQSDLNNFLWVGTDLHEDWEEIWKVLHNQNIRSWRKLNLFEIMEKGDEGLELGDCPNLIGGILMLSHRAVNVLKELLHELVLVREVSVNGKSDFDLIQITNVIDALDKRESEITYLEVSRIVVKINKYIFKKDLVKDQIIFKIPEMDTEIFVTQKFVDKVTETGLKGFVFTEI